MQTKLVTNIVAAAVIAAIAGIAGAALVGDITPAVAKPKFKYTGDCWVGFKKYDSGTAYLCQRRFFSVCGKGYYVSGKPSVARSGYAVKKRWSTVYTCKKIS